MFKKIISLIFHLFLGVVFGVISSGITNVYTDSNGGIIGLVVMLTYWVISFKWIFKNKDKQNDIYADNKHHKSKARVDPIIEPKERYIEPKNITASNVNYINDEDLTEFRLSETFNDIPKQPNKERKTFAKWIKPGEAISINSYDILKGNIYVGGKLKGLKSYETEPSLIDPTLSVSSDSIVYDGEQIGYWPSYSHIGPPSRANYLKWLAGDRDDPETNIGFVFIYFYGIERRLLIDKDVSSEERASLVKELFRLKEIYGSNRSFDGYVTGLLSHIWVLYYNDKETPDWLLLGSRDFTSIFRFTLANIVKEGLHVPASLALIWVKSHPENSLKTPARRCESEFNELFKIRYKKRFGEGLIIPPNKTKLNLYYRSANSSLRGYQDIKLDLPDASRLNAPIKKLFEIAENCTDELNIYSRFVGRPENTKNSLAAISLLPKTLLNIIKPKQLERFKSSIHEKLNDETCLISVKSMLDLFGEEAPFKINKKEAEMFANLAEKAGLGIVPDPSFHHAKPDINGNVVFFLGGHGSTFSPSSAFYQVRAILRLGAMVAKIDDDVSTSEVVFLSNLIKNDSVLSEIEKRSLYAYLRWRLNTESNMSGLKAILNGFNDQKKKVISHVLVSVALADGRIEPSEIKQLEKLYLSLGLDKSLVVSDIHQISTDKKINYPKKKTNISPTSDVLNKENIDFSNEFSLDRELLNIHRQETKDVKSVLESIFIEETKEDVFKEASVVKEKSPKQTFTGLDEKHLALYEKLKTKEKWPLDEVKSFCKDLNLMFGGAIEVINDWAFDIVDAPLIDEGNLVFIDLELVQEIESS